MEIITNAFCASGMHFPNGSYVTFGGNGAIGPTGAIGSVVGPTGTGVLVMRIYFLALSLNKRYELDRILGRQIR